MWRDYFLFVGLKPGKVITAQFGTIDFNADNLGIEILKSLYENDFPYLKITPLGLKTFYENPVQPIPQLPTSDAQFEHGVTTSSQPKNKVTQKKQKH
jgi:hypothetical protein